MEITEVFEEWTNYAKEKPFKKRDYDMRAILRNAELKIVSINGIRRSGKSSLLMLLLKEIDSKKQKIAQIVSDLSEEVYDLVHRYHGSITAEHNDGLIRTPYLKKMYDHQMLGIFRQIKNIFDPQGIFNPGKKVEGTDGSGTKEYMLSHIAF